MTSFGNDSFIKTKVTSFSHQECDLGTLEEIKKCTVDSFRYYVNKKWEELLCEQNHTYLPKFKLLLSSKPKDLAAPHSTVNKHVRRQYEKQLEQLWFLRQDAIEKANERLIHPPEDRFVTGNANLFSS